MELHYFQRYHSKENVTTANAMLLISRLYHYSSNKFYEFMRTTLMGENVDLKLQFKLQESSKDSVPDASITQESFKIVVETKLYNQFDKKQLENHLNSFTDDIKHKVLLTLDPEEMKSSLKTELIECIKLYNEDIKHKHLTFEELIAGIEDILEPTIDYDFLTILNDFKEFCLSSGLLSDEWKWMRAMAVGTTLKFNIDNDLYYDIADRGFSKHAFIGLYNKKEIKAVGKITCIATAEMVGDKLDIHCEKGKLNPEYENKIKNAVDDSKQYTGYNLAIKHRYFFVDKFHKVSYVKDSRGPIQRSKLFNLSTIEGISLNKDTTSEEVASMLNGKTWE